MAKGKGYNTSGSRGGKGSSLEALLAESRALREQIAVDLQREIAEFGRPSQHIDHAPSAEHTDEQSA